MTKPDDEIRLRDLVGQINGYTEAQIDELRKIAASIGNLGTDWRDRAQFRVAIEAIAAIRQFDKASTDLVNTTNRLTRWVLVLTILGALFAAGSLWLSWLALNK